MGAHCYNVVVKHAKRGPSRLARFRRQAWMPVVTDDRGCERTQKHVFSGLNVFVQPESVNDDKLPERPLDADNSAPRRQKCFAGKSTRPTVPHRRFRSPWSIGLGHKKYQVSVRFAFRGRSRLPETGDCRGYVDQRSSHQAEKSGKRHSLEGKHNASLDRPLRTSRRSRRV